MLQRKLILGVDLGVRSIGLAAIDEQANEIVLTAARVFPAGVEGDFESGNDESRNAARREKRLQRRQTARRARRIDQIYRALASHDLLPRGDRHEQLKKLDQQLSTKYGSHPGHPYTLRARGLDHALEPYELGRALFHLSQRRGFLSNRLAPAKKDEDDGKVKSGIKALEADIQAAGQRTLGEYFASLPVEGLRIRGRYTHRGMYLAEFNALWAAQQPHHPAVLTPEFRQKLHHLIFFQRPLKDQSHLIGACSLIPTEKRAPLRHLIVQRFRILDRVNNLRVLEPDQRERSLEPGERAVLIEKLSRCAVATYKQLRAAIGLDKRAVFTIERGGEKSLAGNVTWARFASALNLHWDALPEERQQELVDEWAQAKTDEDFRRRMEAWQEFSADEIDALSDVRLPEDYVGFSLAAIARLMPLLEQGMPTGAARKIAFPESFEGKPALDRLPPVLMALPELRNPAATRVLTEFRKAINEFIRKHGKPEEIHIELARDLKRNKADRQSLSKSMRDNEAKRKAVKEELERHGLHKASRSDVDKYLLYKECGGICPYSGRPISFDSLFGSHPQFDIEHIIPESRSFDNSFANRTLCHRDYNSRKGNRTPWEAFGPTDEWPQMVERVKAFNHRRKLRLFTSQETDVEKILGDFTTSELNDTRYASRLAAQYAAVLYGGRAGSNGVQRVFVCAGQVTARLRQLWRLDGILNPEKWEKSREDHRHHAVDAAAIALASPRLVKALADDSARAIIAGQRRLRSFAEPWLGFREQLADRILNHTVVSHRPQRKLQGPLHEETLYAMRRNVQGETEVRIRKPVHGLKPADIDSIADPSVRQAVRRQFEAVGEMKKLEHDPPFLETRDGRRIPIKKVRIRYSASPVALSDGPKKRWVISGDNHHMEVVAYQKRGKTQYIGHVVSRLEAMRRHREGRPVIQKDHGPDTELLFTLSEGDMVSWKGEIWRVRGVSNQGKGLLVMSRANDARLKAELTKEDLPRPAINVFCSSGGRKVRVSLLGTVQEVKD